MRVNKQIQLGFSIIIFNTHYQTGNRFMSKFEMEILVKPNYDQVYNLCKYIYQFVNIQLIACTNINKNNIGQTYP
jgi:hypothetical protein